jgi:hypothetical protein
VTNVRDGRLKNRGSIFGRAKDFSLLHIVLTGSKTHPASNLTTKICFSQGVKRPGREAYYSPQSDVEAKNCGVIPRLPHTYSWCGA